jgi:hypothetical protein
MSTLTVSTLQASSTTGNIISVASGHSLIIPGSVVQTRQVVKTDTFSAAPNGTWTDITGLTNTISPKKNTSNVMIMVTVIGGGSGTTPKVRIMRGSNVIAVGDTSGSKQSALLGSFLQKDGNQVDTYTNIFIDSPVTTGATTYKVQLNNDNTNTVYINRSSTDSDTSTGGRYLSHITLMEIAT